MTNTLNQKPLIGFLSGIFSGVLYYLKTLLTDDKILKWVAGIGIWLGVIVAALTVWLRIIEISKNQSEKS